MKVGTENKRNIVILSVLMAILIPTVIYFVRSVFGGPSAPPRTAAPAASTQGASSGPAATRFPALATLDPTLHPELMAGAESLKYTGTGRNIFSMSSAPPAKIEAVKGPVRLGQGAGAQHGPAGPTGPPPPPRIDLTFFGYATQNGVKKAFLLHGESVFVASPGQVVDHHFKIVQINPLSIEVRDLLYNDTQTLPLSRS